jgi:glycosyltransferase involved in cell wall biosynthesis
MNETGRWSGGPPRVTVGLPVLNGERFLADALDSILAQEVAELEVIIADNASTDGTQRIAESYASIDPRVRYVRHSIRHGAAYNFNFVARAARGTYFKWAAHDDVCGPRFLATCMGVLEADPGAVLCYPRAAEIDATGAETRSFPYYHFAHEDRAPARVRSFLVERPACLETYGVMRRDVMLETRMIGPFSSSDGVFLLEMMLRGQFRSVDEVAFFCRKHPDRSLEQHRVSRRHWYAGGATGGRGFPEWRLAAELVRSVERAPIGSAEKGRCFGHIAAWAGRKTPELAHDVATTVRSTLARRRRPSDRALLPSPGGES